VKFSTVLLRVIAAFAVVSLIQVLAGMLATIFLPVAAPLPDDGMRHFMPWMLLSNAVTIAALSVVAVRTEWRGMRLGFSVALIPLAIVGINGIDGIVFLKNLPIEWPRIFLTSAITALLSAPVWMLLFGTRQDTPAEHFHPLASKSLGERVWKLVTCDLTYLVLYLAAGVLIFPYVKSFYASQALPSTTTIVGLQLLVRGPLFILLCLLLTRMLGMPRRSGALAVGLLFTVLSGMAPLLMPNPYFPDSVRWAHFAEVVSENFIFGVMVAWLWGQPKLVHSPALAHAA
jgi:hypothetical protein